MSKERMEPAVALQAEQKYRPIAQLGQTGISIDYLTRIGGEESGFAKLAVLTRLGGEWANHRALRESFLDQGRVGSRLSHPNVVTTFEVGDDAGGPFIAQEFLEGQRLSSVLSRAGAKLPVGIALHVLTDLLSGLRYAHDLRDFHHTPLRIVHGDVSPQNIFVLYTGQTKLVNFGLGKSRRVAGTAGPVSGQVRYTAPEQAQGLEPDARADVFAVGVLLWEVLTGGSFWGARRASEIRELLATGFVAPSPRTIALDLAPELEMMCMRAVAPDPADRFASAEDFLVAIEQAVVSLDVACTAREVGRFVETLFVEDRARAREMIEHLTRLPPESLKQLPTLASTVEPLTVVMESQLRAVRAPLNAREDSGAEVFHEGSSPTQNDAGRGRARLMIVVASLLTVVGATTWWLGHSADRQPTPSAASKPTTAEVASAAGSAAPVSRGGEEQERDVTISIVATPPGASIFVDGKAVPNPYRASHRPDNGPHRLRVTAQDHAPVTRDVRFDSDLQTEIVLTPIYVPPPPARPRALAVGGAASTASPAAPPATREATVGVPTTFDESKLEAPPPKSRAQLDSNSPWK